MSVTDFCGLTPEEFSEVCKAHTENVEADYRDAWERTRILAAIVIQPHIRRSITPAQLISLPWDIKRKPTAPLKPVSKEEDLKRFERLLKRTGYKSDRHNNQHNN